MTTEQLEELLAKVTPETEDGWWPATNYEGMPILGPDQELIALATSLARRAIAAEKLVEAVDTYLTGSTGHRDLARAITAYREASK